MKRVVWFLVGLVLGQGALASPKRDLNHLHHEIHRLKADINQTKHSRETVQGQIRRLEQRISLTAKRQFELQAKQQRIEEAIHRLDKESQQATLEEAQHEANVSALIVDHYQHRLAAPEKSDREIAPEFWLQLEYLTVLTQDQDMAAQMAQTRATHLEQLSRQQRQKATELKQVVLKLNQQTRLLSEQKSQRAALYAELSKTEQNQQQKLDSLIRNEKSLTQLIQQLEKRAKQTPRRSKRHSSSSIKEERAREEGSVGRNTELPESLGQQGSFAHLKGQLHLPLIGELANRFGSPRSDTGLTWHGLFIKAPEGQSVKAVGSGRVVYANWLRGFGNMVIIDHGDGYMSLYGDAQALLVGVGQQVNMGDSIATSGSLGANSQSGIYFELRYQSKPFDPLLWVGHLN